MAELDRVAFARGVNDAIRALRGVYGGVRTMFDELRGAVEETDPPLFDLRIRARPGSRKNADEKILRTWEGRFYTADAAESDVDSDDEEAEDAEEADDDSTPSESSKKRTVSFTTGQNVAFVKVVLYHPGAGEDEPHLLYGVLRDCRVTSKSSGDQLEVRRNTLGRVLEEVRSDMKLGPLHTRASVRWPAGLAKSARKKGGNRLVFQVAELPRRVALFDLRGHDQVQGIAEGLRTLWQAAG
jgi:hypothetical protein